MSNVNALQPYQLSRISEVLRKANARYRDVADALYASITPTHHARRRARCLGLTIDITKAINCPYRFVSLIPLPQVDTTLSANEEVALAASELTVLTVGMKSLLAAKPSLPRLAIPEFESTHGAARPSPVLLRDGSIPCQGSTIRISESAPGASFSAASLTWEKVDLPGHSDAESLTSDGTSSSSSSSASSADSITALEPITPDDVYHTIPRIKRKTIESEEEGCDKRAKYF